MKKTQTTVVLEHLRKRPITQAEAATKYAIFGLAKVISLLRAAGNKIDGSMAEVTVGGTSRRMNRYTLIKEAR
ncbi:MAG: helix-turn-helix domain-containing protein [Burkholderiales bacterium]|jgi:hypothetical protein|nr:helix-turn-helix domain-containing protein [Burkholderiales bacterium]